MSRPQDTHSRPKVSVAMVAYNHERFIGQAIESVLAQDLDEPFEVVVGEDCSPDRTGEIAREFEERHPDRVRVLKEDHNLGRRPNYLRTLRACRGEYIAQLDGDDWFLGPSKLRRQVEVLDADETLAGCVHVAQNVFDDGSPTRELRPPVEQPRYGVTDLARQNQAASCTLMFRNGVFGDFPAWFHHVPVGDWPLQVLVAEHGDIAFLPEILSAHRVHDGGVWAGTPLVARLRTNLETRSFLADHLGPAYADPLRTGEFKDRFALVRELERTDDLPAAYTESTWCRRHLRYRGTVSLTKFWRRHLRILAKRTVRPGPAASGESR